MDILVKDIIRLCNGRLICGNENKVLGNFNTDTRIIEEGDTFVGIKGEKFDGNEYYNIALEKGASICILQDIDIDNQVINKYRDIAIIVVEDTIKALGILAKYKRSLYDIPVIAITGSVGKTSTKDIVANVVSQKYNVLKTQGNFNNHIGLPLTILQLKDHDALVVEMGMNNLREIAYLSDIANPTLAVITNVGTSHIGNLGSRENILKAKLEILEGLRENGILIINNDNDLLNRYYKENMEKNIYTYGINEKSNINPNNIQINENESIYTINLFDKEYKVEVPISGTHFIYNSLCAISVGLQLGIDMDKIIAGIKTFELTKNRMDIQIIRDDIKVINDSYNASYDSMKSGLEYLKNMNGIRKIAILGDMLELGEFSKDLHEKVGYEVVYNKIDILIAIGEEAVNIYNKAIELGMNKEYAYYFKTKEKAIDMIKNNIKSGDVILLKASNGMKFSWILDNIK